MLVLHGCFFLYGYFQKTDAKHLSNSIYLPSAGFVIFSILISALILICWLIFYFRNNALKRLYPISVTGLIKEYSIVLLTTLLICTPVFTYRLAHTFNLLGYVREEKAQLEDEANTINLASAFLPQSFDLYHKDQSSKNKMLPPPPAPDGPAPPATSSGPANQVTGNTNTSTDFSYLNYCNTAITPTDNGKVMSAQDIHGKVNQWLLQHQRDSVKNIIERYLAILDKYDCHYNFDAKKQVNLIFSDSSFTVTAIIPSYLDRYNSEKNLTYPDEYISDYNATSSIQSLLDFESHAFDNTDMNISFLFFSFYIAVLIFSFRLTRTRTWVAALIGAPLWGILFMLLGVISRNTPTLTVMYIILALLFLIVSSVNIFNRSNKKYTGVLLTWFFWALPSFLPVCFAFLQSISRPETWYLNNMDHNATHDGLYYMIENNWNTILYGNFIFIFMISCMVVIPLARKWQSNPEQ